MWKACDLFSANEEVWTFAGGIQEKIRRYCQHFPPPGVEKSEIMRTFLNEKLACTPDKDRGLYDVLTKTINNPYHRLFVTDASEVRFTAPYFDQKYMRDYWVDKPGASFVLPMLHVAVAARMQLITTAGASKSRETALLHDKAASEILEAAFDQGLESIGDPFGPGAEGYQLIFGTETYTTYTRAISAKLSQGHNVDGKASVYNDLAIRAASFVSDVLAAFKGPNGEILPYFSIKLLKHAEELVDCLGSSSLLVSNFTLISSCTRRSSAGRGVRMTACLTRDIARSHPATRKSSLRDMLLAEPLESQMLTSIRVHCSSK